MWSPPSNYNPEEDDRILIVVEGSDGAGKTTLVRYLSTKFGLRVGKRAQKDRKLLYKSTRQDTYTALAQAVDGKTPPQIWDRLFFSEQVYASLVGRSPEFSLPEQVWIKGMLTAIPAVTILCLPPRQVCIENATKDEQMDGVNENLPEIWQAYFDMAHQFYFVYDYTSPTNGRLQPIERKISMELNNWKERVW